jgi:ABC-type Fe3+/spermidine/putrescine transport system ATPase subunit
LTRVRLVDLSRAFGTVWAVRDVSLEVAEGEFFSLLGPSGCGKTTTLRMIAGLDRPTAGRVWFGGDDVTDVAPQDRNVGLVFQSYAVFPTMTVFDNVAYGLRIRRRPADETARRVDRMLEIVGLGALRSRMPSQLSGGQLQRVALARALAIEPRLLLLDEPLSNLDAKLRVDVRAEIRTLQRNLGITTIYVSHDQEETLSLSDRIGVMAGGRLDQVGRPEDIYHAPATRFVAGFVGEGAMLDGRLQRDGTLARIIVAPQIEIRVALGARGADDVRPGPVWVCVRPEAVRPRVAATGRGPIVSGVIVHREFVGSTVRVQLAVPGLPAPLRATAASGDVGTAFAVGSTMEVEIDPAGISFGAAESS